MKKSVKGSMVSVKVIRKINLGKDRSEAYFPELLGATDEVPVRKNKR